MRFAHFGGAAQQADTFCEVDIDALAVDVVAAERIEASCHAGVGKASVYAEAAGQVVFVGQVFGLGDEVGYFLFGESGALSCADNGRVFLRSAGSSDAFFLKTFYGFLCGEVAVFGSFGVPFERSGGVRCRAVAVFVHYGHKTHRQGVASFGGGEIPCEGTCDVFLDAMSEFVHAAEIVSGLNVSGDSGLFVVCGGFVVFVLGVEDSGGAHHGVGVAAVGTAAVPFERFPGVARTASAGFIVEIAEESLCAGHAYFCTFLD